MVGSSRERRLQSQSHRTSTHSVLLGRKSLLHTCAIWSHATWQYSPPWGKSAPGQCTFVQSATGGNHRCAGRFDTPHVEKHRQSQGGGTPIDRNQSSNLKQHPERGSLALRYDFRTPGRTKRIKESADCLAGRETFATLTWSPMTFAR